MGEGTIRLLPARVICNRHGEILRDRWPRGYPEFVSAALRRFLALPDTAGRVQAEAIAMGAEAPVTADRAAAFEHLLAERPLCCQFTPADLLEVYLELMPTGIWRIEYCVVCGHHGYGGIMRRRPLSRLVNPARRNPTWGHVCLECVCGIHKMHFSYRSVPCLPQSPR